MAFEGAGQRLPPRERKPDGGRGLVWQREIALDSRDGERCQREERERCESDQRYNREQRDLQEQREQEYFAWLDDQLAPHRVDTKLSEQVEARTADALRRRGEAQPKVKVKCVIEFCRIELDADPRREDLRAAAWEGIDWHASSSNARQDASNPRRSLIYLTRPGWVLPQPFSLSQRGRGSRFRTP